MASEKDASPPVQLGPAGQSTHHEFQPASTGKFKRFGRTIPRPCSAVLGVPSGRKRAFEKPVRCAQELDAFHLLGLQFFQAEARRHALVVDQQLRESVAQPAHARRPAAAGAPGVVTPRRRRNTSSTVASPNLSISPRPMTVLLAVARWRGGALRCQTGGRR